MKFSVNQIAGLINAEINGNGDEEIRMLAKIQSAQKGEIAFLSNPKYESYLYTTNASAVIVKRGFVPKKKVNTILLLVDDPYSSFTILLEEYHKILNFQKTGTEEPSFIGSESTVGTEVYRGAFSYIGNQVRIGNHVKIYPHVFIGDNVQVGDRTIIHPQVKIYQGCVIGNDCILHAGAVIGSDGFGFAPQEDGSYKTIPQLGHVVLEDNVYIGANTTIDCATLLGDATLIRQGAKLDNLIQIGHNVEIGRNTVIAGQAGVSGSTKVGDNCLLAGQVGIAGHLFIANRTAIAAQSGISKSVNKEGARLMGYPAYSVKDYYQSYALFKQLPALSKRLEELEKRLNGSSNGSAE